MATTKRPSGLEQALIGFFQGVNTGIPAGVQQGRQQEKLEAERLRKEAADAVKFQAEQIKLNEKIFNFIQTNDRTSAINVFGAENVERIVPTEAETLADVDLAQAEFQAKETAETGLGVGNIPTPEEVEFRKTQTTSATKKRLEDEAKVKRTEDRKILPQLKRNTANMINKFNSSKDDADKNSLKSRVLATQTEITEIESGLPVFNTLEEVRAHDARFNNVEDDVIRNRVPGNEVELGFFLMEEPILKNEEWRFNQELLRRMFGVSE